MDSPPSTPETAKLAMWCWCTILYHTILWCTILWVADVTWIDYQITSGHSYYSTAAHCNGTPLSSWLLFLFSRWFPHTLGSHQQLCHHKLGISIHSTAGRSRSRAGISERECIHCIGTIKFFPAISVKCLIGHCFVSDQDSGFILILSICSIKRRSHTKSKVLKPLSPIQADMHTMFHDIWIWEIMLLGSLTQQQWRDHDDRAAAGRKDELFIIHQKINRKTCQLNNIVKRLCLCVTSLQIFRHQTFNTNS